MTKYYIFQIVSCNLAFYWCKDLKTKNRGFLYLGRFGGRIDGSLLIDDFVLPNHCEEVKFYSSRRSAHAQISRLRKCYGGVFHVGVVDF